MGIQARYMSVLSRKNAAAGGSSITLSSESNDSTTAINLLNTVDWTAKALGAADANRKIALCIAFRSTNVGVSLDVCTVGGVSLTRLINKETASSGNSIYSQIWIGSVPTGTTATVSISPDATITSWLNWNLYRLVDSSSTAYATATHDGTGGTTINVEAGGVILGAGGSVTAGPAATMTGLTENYDVLTDFNSDVAAAGSHESASGETNRSVRINMGDATYDSAAFAALSPV
jgi:hypothetical protein